ncbi:MAG: FAD-binding oxidoreductase [Chloroflexi bacterium]|nr:FAD-binding oxidoreductase [Chloroflexota bacterium]
MLTDKDIASLRAIVGDDDVSVRQADLEAHSVDESWLDPHPPEAVVWPASTEEVAAVLRYANERDLPVSAWSGGSSLEGNPIPVRGGVVLAMYRMKRVLEIREQDLQVVVEPGIVYDDLNAQLRRLGLFFPPAPGSSDVATIGGMVANNASGMRAVKYGVTRDYVQSLKVVLADGTVVRLGSDAKKTTSGYDLKSLFVGSEGTLGITTEITLRLVGLPEAVGVVVAAYDELEGATNSVYETVRYGLNPSAIEILDAETVRVTNEQQGLSLAIKPTLFVEFHGTEASVQEQLGFLREICEDNGCATFQETVSDEEREYLWKARKEAHDSIKFSNPGKTMVSGDVCVPISRFGEMFPFVHDLARQLDLKIYAFGHAGDGNMHTETIADRSDPDEFARAHRATEAIVRRALEVGGTVAGEHGIGRAKREFLEEEHGASVALMRQIKQIFDPRGIMNPGKIFDD